MEVYLICDESGAKGRDKVGEKEKGEVGVFAGCFVPDRKLSEFELWSQAAASKYFRGNKTHISGLPKSDQLSLEHEVFDLIKSRTIICAYEAIYAEGFKDGRLSEIQLYENIEKLSPGLKNLYKKHKRPLSLHQILFTGLLDKAIAFLSDHCDPSNDELRILVDRVDSGVLKLLERAIEDTLEMGKGLDTFANPPICANHTADGSNNPEELGILKVLKTLRGKINIDQASDNLTLIPDIIAHSLYQHFMKFDDNEIGGLLNSPVGLVGHELANIFYGQSDLLDGMNWWTDAQYMYPRSEA